MANTAIICINECGGYCEVGRARSKAQWVAIILTYEKCTWEYGSCSIRCLAGACQILRQSAHKAIDYHKIGAIVPPMLPKGHGRVGVGSMYGTDMMHHVLIYELYVKNPLLPLHGYIEDMYRKYGLLLHISLIEHWFMKIGPFKRTMRLTTRYPSGRDT